MMMLLVLVIVTLCALLYRFTRYRRRFHRALATIPGPRGVPLLGNAAELMKKDTTELHDKFETWVRGYGPRMKIDLCSKFWVIHTSPELIEKIVTNNAFSRKSRDYDYLHEWLGVGILLDHGPKWHTSRKALTDAFHFQVLENFLPVYQEQSEILVDKLLSHGGRAVDIFPVLKLYTLEVILETAMGVQCNAQLNDSAYVRAVAGLTHITFWRMYNVLGQNDLTFRFSEHYKPYCEMIKVSDDFTKDVVRRRRRELVNDGEDGPRKGAVQKRRLALLDKLIQMDVYGRKLVDEEICAQVNNFMFAGHDTTSSALTFIIYLIAKHPDVQEKLFTEVNTVLGGNVKKAFTQSIVHELKYMDQVIKEALRLFPPVPYVSRTVDVDTELDGVTYPAGTAISLGIFYMHRDPAYYPQPTCFKPDRFSAEAEAKGRNPYVYIPFSAGSRNCIGQKFALNEMKVALSQIVMRCRMEPEDPDFVPRLKDELILKPSDGMPIRFFPRE